MGWVATVSLVVACGERAKPRLSAATSAALSVATYNVNHERFAPQTVAAAAGLDVDVMFLQEVTQRWRGALDRALAGRYSHVRYMLSPPEGGMAVYSRFPVRSVRFAIEAEGLFPAWCLKLVTPHGPLRIIAVHLHPPVDEYGIVSGYLTTDDERGAEMKAHLACFDAAPDLVVGSFNEDFGEATRAVAALGLGQAQMAARVVKPTWRWPTMLYDFEGRPDHIMYGRRLVPVAVDVVDGGASDHLPLTAAFRLSESGSGRRD